MFRSTVFAIVLSLAVGPAARLICEAGCGPRVAEASGCRQSHHGPATTVAGIDACGTRPVLAVTSVRDDTRRLVAPPDERHAVLGTAGYIAARGVSHDIRSFRRDGPPVQRRPLTPALRI